MEEEETCESAVFVFRISTCRIYSLLHGPPPWPCCGSSCSTWNQMFQDSLFLQQQQRSESKYTRNSKRVQTKPVFMTTEYLKQSATFSSFLCPPEIRPESVNSSLSALQCACFIHLMCFPGQSRCRSSVPEVEKNTNIMTSRFPLVIPTRCCSFLTGVTSTWIIKAVITSHFFQIMRFPSLNNQDQEVAWRTAWFPIKETEGGADPRGDTNWSRWEDSLSIRWQLSFWTFIIF